MSAIQPVLLGGAWRASAGEATFQATNPRTMEPIADRYPISPWPEIEEALPRLEDALRQLG